MTVWKPIFQPIPYTASAHPECIALAEASARRENNVSHGAKELHYLLAQRDPQIERRRNQQNLERTASRKKNGYLKDRQPKATIS